jgi:hypothetical protein
LTPHEGNYAITGLYKKRVTRKLNGFKRTKEKNILYCKEEYICQLLIIYINIPM